jgi:hypothetical protein
MCIVLHSDPTREGAPCVIGDCIFGGQNLTRDVQPGAARQTTCGVAMHPGTRFGYGSLLPAGAVSRYHIIIGVGAFL